VITVFGASGFIGSHLVAHLSRAGIPFEAPARGEPLTGRPLGHVIDCIGLTADFRDRPFETIEAHVGRLPATLTGCTFDSYLYLSSTRLYLRSSSPAREEDPLGFEPCEPEDIYGLSKATGEALVLALGSKGRVARLSAVYGPSQKDTFLALIIEEARSAGVIRLRTALDSEKDYVSVDDVTDLLVKIALGGRHRLYNIASGRQVSHKAIVEALAAATGCRVEVAPGAPSVRFPAIDPSRIREEFGFVSRDVLDALPALAARA
jgi:nucleoside-diphosphate-sugar epimerase